MAPKKETMDRGSNALKTHMASCPKMEIRQTRRGWCQEIMGCEAKTEFKYFIDGTQVAHSLEDTDCFCRICCAPIHPYKMAVKELNTEAEIVTVDRPCACALSGCKCCCYQNATVTSGNNTLGRMEETCWYCVPSFKIYDHEEKELYTVHQPTCIGGMCVNCCAEGNPCGKGCCKASFRIYPAGQTSTDGDAPYLGMIMKKPKSMMTEVFTDANAFDLDFPKEATADHKGLLIGAAIFINSIFFEGQDDGAAVAV